MSQDKEREALIACLSNAANTLHAMPMETAELCALLREAVAALASQQAVKGEPVAWRYSVQPQVLGPAVTVFSETKDVPDAQPLYASPPSREPLTEWEARGMLARLKCWHRLTEQEADELVQFAMQGGAHMREVEPQWQPIETAPKDGGHVLLLVPNGRLEGEFLRLTGRWFATGCWITFNADEAIQRVEPTHWMPLPPPPGIHSRGEGEKA